MQYFVPYYHSPWSSRANTPRSSPKANEAPEGGGSFSSGLPPRLPKRSSKPNLHDHGSPDAEKGLRKSPSSAAVSAGAGLDGGLPPFSMQVLLCVGLVVVLVFTLIPLVGMGHVLHRKTLLWDGSSNETTMSGTPMPGSRSLAAGDGSWSLRAGGMTATPRVQAPAATSAAAASTISSSSATRRTSTNGAGSSGVHAAAAPPLQLLQSADMGLQQARLWGSWNGTALWLQLWFKLMCDSSAPGGLLLRGFAMAEPVKAVPFFFDHPVLPENFAKDLPPLQIIRTDTSKPPQTCINFYEEYVHRNIANVWHFQARIPSGISPHIVGLGVPGWPTVAPFSFTPQCPSQQQVGSSHPSNATGTATATDNGASTPLAVAPGAAGAAKGLSSPHPHRESHAWQTPGSIWGVVAPLEGRPLEQHAFLLLRYLHYHQQLGINGVIQFMVSSSSTRELLRYPGIAEAVQEGSLAFWLWDGASHHNRPYYPQTHVYNAALLAGWGHDLHLMLSDLDEYLVLMQDDTLREALQPGHCLHDVSQIRIDRFDSALNVPTSDGDLVYWMADQDPCQSILLNQVDLGPTDPWQTPWKSIVHPDEVAIYHSHNGAVLSMKALEAQAAGTPPAVVGLGAQSQDADGVGGEAGDQGPTRRLQWGLRPAKARLHTEDKDSTTAETDTEQEGTKAADSRVSSDADAAEQGDGAADAAPAPAGERKPQDERYTDRSCAYIMHFINLFRERRPIDGPDEKPMNRTADFSATVNACRSRYELQ